jgi:hypothetical protein
VKVLLPESRARASLIFPLRQVVFSTNLTSRCCDHSFAVAWSGKTHKMFVGAWSIVKPIQLNPASVAPTCVPFMKSTSRVNDDGAKQSMISRIYGVRDVLYWPRLGPTGTPAVPGSRPPTGTPVSWAAA